MAPKEAVIFILDSSPFMMTPYPRRSPSTEKKSPIENIPDTTNPTPSLATPPPSSSSSTPPNKNNKTLKTRLSLSQSIIEKMTLNLMTQSKTNEVGIILIKTQDTKHHLYPTPTDSNGKPRDLVFPNITTLGSSVETVTRPTVELLRELRAVTTEISRTASSTSSHDGTLGDFVDGLIVATDAMFRRTAKRKYKRRIILFTDGCHDVTSQGLSDETIRMALMEGLRGLECPLTVIGFDFTSKASFNDSTPLGDIVKPTINFDDDDNDVDLKNNNKTTPNETVSTKKSSSPSFIPPCSKIQSENEKILLSLARHTNGSIIAASNMTMNDILLSTTQKKNIKKSTCRKLKLTIAPTCHVTARYSLLASKTTPQNLKKRIVAMNETNGRIMKNGMGEEMTDDILTTKVYIQEKNTNNDDCRRHANNNDDGGEEEVGTDELTNAYAYGSDLIPMGQFDLEGLKLRSDPWITILGYVPMDHLPRRYVIGSPYCLTGGGGSSSRRRSTMAIAALARALEKMTYGAVGRFVKSKDADPVMVAMFPLCDSNRRRGCEKSLLRQRRQQRPRHLYFVQMPFKDDVNKIFMPPLMIRREKEGDDDDDDDDAEKVCDDLIDSLMLPDDTLQSHLIANPFIKSLNQNVVRRAIDPTTVTRIEQNYYFSRNLVGEGDNVVDQKKRRDDDDDDDDDDDPMAIPSHVRQRSKEVVDRFHRMFLLKTTMMGE